MKKTCINLCQFRLLQQCIANRAKLDLIEEKWTCRRYVSSSRARRQSPLSLQKLRLHRPPVAVSKTLTNPFLSAYFLNSVVKIYFYVANFLLITSMNEKPESCLEFERYRKQHPIVFSEKPNQVDKLLKFWYFFYQIFSIQNVWNSQVEKIAHRNRKEDNHSRTTIKREWIFSEFETSIAFLASTIIFLIFSIII